MLALVHPLQHSSSDVHRAPPSSSASNTRTSSRQTTRRPLITSTSSSSLPPSSRTSANPQPPPLAHRHQTAPQQPPPARTHHTHHHHHEPPLQNERPPSPVIHPIQTPPPEVQAPAPTFDIHSYPAPELLKLLASLLTQIAATNDKLEAASPSHSEPPSNTPSRTSLSSLRDTDAPIWRTLMTASRTAISTPSSVLTFHARNIPTITLEAYLLRILKYCPTTNEVFLSLLIYFDRMTKLSEKATGKPFVIDSYNIHRLVIAGVTVASKFFSDVFYTNSRYAKVGGLPQTELNQLELQFLLLNDFRLVIHNDEMQRYAEQLILFSQSDSTPKLHPVLGAPTLPLAASPDPDTDQGQGSNSTSASNQNQAAMMGAVDAYGGRIPGDEIYAYRNPLQTSQSRSEPTLNEHPASHHHNSAHPYHLVTSDPTVNGVNGRSSYTPRAVGFEGDDREPETETETEPETGTETDDASETTDDEPTIRPTHSSFGSSGDTSSLCSFGSRESRGEDDNRSLYSTGDEGGDEDGGDDDDDTEDDMDIFERRKGRAENGGDDDGGMTPESKAAAAAALENGEMTPERKHNTPTWAGANKVKDLDVDHRMASP